MFAQNEWSELVTSKTAAVFVANDKIGDFEEKLEFLKLSIHCLEADNFPGLKMSFLMRSVVLWASVTFLMLLNAMCQHLEHLHNSVNQFDFPVTCASCYKIQNAR